MDARVRLLVDHGVDPDTVVGGRYGVASRPAYAAAVTSGQLATAELLLGLGATPVLSEEERAIGAVFSGERVEHAETAIAARPGLIPWAAELGKADAVRRAAELGWDVNGRARTDVPSDQGWDTGLHAAAGNGDSELVELLIELGADPGATDARFGATPAGWAEHFGHAELAAYLTDRSG
jgi:hypothetical protein